MSLRSGIWKGYYEQGGMRVPQQMRLEFADGLLRGSGDDEIGPSTIEGEFRIGDGVIRVAWIKTYDGGHSVLYLGTWTDGVIEGTWDIHGYGEAFGMEYSAEDSDR